MTDGLTDVSGANLKKVCMHVGLLSEYTAVICVAAFREVTCDKKRLEVRRMSEGKLT